MSTAFVASCPSLWIVYLVFGSETDASEREGHWRLACLYFCKIPLKLSQICESESFFYHFLSCLVISSAVLEKDPRGSKVLYRAA